MAGAATMRRIDPAVRMTAVTVWKKHIAPKKADLPINVVKKLLKKRIRWRAVATKTLLKVLWESSLLCGPQAIAL